MCQLMVVCLSMVKQHGTVTLSSGVWGLHPIFDTGFIGRPAASKVAPMSGIIALPRDCTESVSHSFLMFVSFLDYNSLKH